MSAPFVVMYRWRLKPEREQTFVTAWSERTEWLKRIGGSLGSRLHKGSDGVWYSYAQWPSAEARASAFASSDGAKTDGGRQMADCVIEELPEVILDVRSDYINLAS